jgi:hypothetical protein
LIIVWFVQTNNLITNLWNNMMKNRNQMRNWTWILKIEYEFECQTKLEWRLKIEGSTKLESECWTWSLRSWITNLNEPWKWIEASWVEAWVELKLELNRSLRWSWIEAEKRIEAWIEPEKRIEAWIEPDWECFRVESWGDWGIRFRDERKEWMCF